MIIFVFKGCRSIYLVPADSEEDAWEKLTKRLSCRLNLTKRSHQLIEIINENSDIVKLKY